jgi:hypothetical protein
VQQKIGYPLTEAIDNRRYAYQYFDTGYLYWWDRPDGPGLIWSIEIEDPDEDRGSHWTGPYEDEWDGLNPYSCDAAQEGEYGPVSGFGKLWCDTPYVNQAMGNAREAERGTGDSSRYGIVQLFQGGLMLYSPLDMLVWVLYDEGGWQHLAP